MMLILFIYLKGCFRYIWAYNNVYAAVIIISCSLQNIYHTKLTSFYSQQDPALFFVIAAPVVHRLAHIQPRDNQGKHNFFKKNVRIILMGHASVLTPASSY